MTTLPARSTGVLLTSDSDLAGPPDVGAGAHQAEVRLVVEEGRAELRRSMQRLRHVNAPPAGVVLTRVPHKRAGRYGYEATVGMRTPADDAGLSGFSGSSETSGFTRSRG